MPNPSERSVTYQVDAERNLILVRLHGMVDAAFIADVAKAIAQDPAWHPGIHVIWDNRDVRFLEITPDGLDAMVEAQTHGSHGLDLIVTTHPDHDFVMRLYARRVNMRGRPATVCSTMREALDVLDLSALPPSLQPSSAGSGADTGAGSGTGPAGSANENDEP